METRPTTLFPIAVLTVLATVIPSQGADSPASLAAGTDSTALGKKYSLVLSPVWKVGQKFGYFADAANKIHSASSDGDALGEFSIAYECHIEGTGEAMAVAANGTMTKMNLVVSAMNVTANGKPVADRPAIAGIPSAINVLAAGTKLVIERDSAGREIFTVIEGKPIIGTETGDKALPSMNLGRDGQPTYSGAAWYLRMLIDLDDSPGTDQEVFAPKEAVAIGDSWPAQANARTKLLEACGDVYRAIVPPVVQGTDASKLVFPPTTVTMKFKDVTGHDADQAAVVTGNFSINGMDIPTPPTSPLRGAPPPPKELMDMQGDVNLSCPVSPGKGILTKTSALSFKLYPNPVQPPGLAVNGAIVNYDFKYTHQITSQ